MLDWSCLRVLHTLSFTYKHTHERHSCLALCSWCCCVFLALCYQFSFGSFCCLVYTLFSECGWRCQPVPFLLSVLCCRVWGGIVCSFPQLYVLRSRGVVSRGAVSACSLSGMCTLLQSWCVLVCGPCVSWCCCCVYVCVCSNYGCMVFLCLGLRTVSVVMLWCMLVC